MTMRPTYLRALVRAGRFRRNDEGAALVEFALVVPICLMLFAVTIEGARTFWAYQTVISGVRDAVRFVGRAAPNDICISGGTLAAYDDQLVDIVANTREGNTLFPASIQVTSVKSSLTYINDDFRLQQTPIVTVVAQLTIEYPFSSVLGLFSVNQPTVNTYVSDSSRVFGA